jgi:predicted PhzF superfamily epimerase YddE/YHI9
VVAVVQDDPATEAMAQQLAQALDTSEIAFVDGAGRFHFDAAPAN